MTETEENKVKKKKTYEHNGKEYNRFEYVKVLRHEKKEKLNKYRKEHGIPGLVSKYTNITVRVFNLKFYFQAMRPYRCE